MKIVEIWINCPTREVAEQIADSLVSRRLVACANIHGDIHSTYHWQQKVEREKEIPLLLKTREELFDRIVEEVRQIHPYDTPSIIGIPVTLVNNDYREWVIRETG